MTNGNRSKARQRFFMYLSPPRRCNSSPKIHVKGTGLLHLVKCGDHLAPNTSSCFPASVFVLRALLNRHAVKMENEFSYALIRETRKTTGKCFHLFLANINTSLGLPVVCFTTLTWILFEYSADNALTSSGANPWLSRKMRNVTLPL